MNNWGLGIGDWGLGIGDQVSGLGRRSLSTIHYPLITLLLFTFHFLLFTPHVSAHAELLTAVPAPGESVTEPPSEIQLTFNEPIGSGSDVFVFSEGFNYVDDLTVQIVGERELLVTLPSLAPDDYTVQWTAISADGHAVSGSYTFRVMGETAVFPARLPLIIAAILVTIGAFVLFFRHSSPKNAARQS